MTRIRNYSQHLQETRQKDESHESDGAMNAELHFHSPTNLCFLCGKPLGDDLVHWHGLCENNIQIWLHPECAVRLGKSLIHDGT
jgi:hypothetical protein